jgi:hypothetical protein
MKVTIRETVVVTMSMEEARKLNDENHHTDGASLEQTYEETQLALVNAIDNVIGGKVDHPVV